MSVIQTTCPHCRASVSLDPAEVLLITRPDGPATYLIACGACDAVSAKRADAIAEWLLLAAGVVPSPTDAPQHKPLPLELDELADLLGMLLTEDAAHRRSHR